MIRYASFFSVIGIVLIVTAGISCADGNGYIEPAADSWGMGLGSTFDRLPIPMSKISFPLAYMFYEKALDNDESIRFSVSGLGGVVPVPTIEYVKAFMEYPVEILTGAGVFYDPFLGGHGGVFLKAGTRISGRYEISLRMVPFGIENEVNYSTLKENLGEGTIQFPYFAVIISVRNPL